MSYAEVFRILPNGDVESFKEVRNGSAGAPVIWSHLSEKLGLKRYGDEAKLWARLADPAFTRAERVCLVFTYDGAWVKRENIPELVKALRAMWTVIDVPDREGYRISPTIHGMADALEELYAEPEIRGACFRMTSVCNNPWALDDEADEEYEEMRSFNFDRDKLNAYKAEPVEVVDTAATALPGTGNLK